MKKYHTILFKTVAAAFMLGTLTQCNNEAKKEGAETNNQSADEGWEILFDGKDLSNFRNFKKEDVNPKWVVKDGEFTLTAGGGGDLMTKKQYSSFEIKLDYKISKGGNSGLMYHVSETENTPWLTGPEVQIIDDVDGHDAQKSGWLYGLYPATFSATNPAGEWNSLHVIITPEKCVHYMNGKKYCEYVKGSADWNKKVAASKFVKFPKFGKATTGHICLQDHGNVVSFRNVKIKDLSKK